LTELTLTSHVKVTVSLSLGAASSLVKSTQDKVGEGLGLAEGEGLGDGLGEGEGEGLGEGLAAA